MNGLRYNEVSMKTSHNSYNRKEDIVQQITWNDEKDYDCGCGGIELDIRQSSKGNEWSVGHIGGYVSSPEKQLLSYLNKLVIWSKKNPNHDVITVHLDIKGTHTDHFPSDLDAYLSDHFCSQVALYTPGELMGDQDTLSEGALNNGWPTLEDLREKFIICLTGNHKDYATTSPRERLCFTDKAISVGIMPEDPHRVFFNFHIYNNSKEKWTKIFRQCVSKPNVITRAYEANSQSNWENCLKSGCNLIATNEISDHDWAKVGNSRFAKIQLIAGFLKRKCYAFQ